MTRQVQLSFGRLLVSTFGGPRLTTLPFAVEREVLAHASTPEGARVLADLLDAFPDTPERTAQRVLEALECGRLQYEGWSPPTSLAGPRDVADPLTELASEEEEQLVVHTVILELLDTQDRPVAGAAYTVVDPSGRAHSGSLDAQGRAEIREIKKAGNCKVCFPEFDSRAWTYVSAHPL